MLTRDDLLQHARALGAPLDVLCFWGHTPPAAGGVGPWCLSQWYEAPFALHGLHFPTAEHYMMWSKAELFGDGARAEEALRAPDPRAAKRAGRLVAGFEPARWDAHKRDIVLRGSLAKFGAHPALRAYLLSTAPRVLVEASPHDAVWGVGMRASEAARDPARWRGENLLGFALMAARDALGAHPGAQ